MTNIKIGNSLDKKHLSEPRLLQQKKFLHLVGIHIIPFVSWAFRSRPVPTLALLHVVASLAISKKSIFREVPHWEELSFPFPYDEVQYHMLSQCNSVKHS